MCDCVENAHMRAISLVLTVCHSHSPVTTVRLGIAISEYVKNDVNFGLALTGSNLCIGTILVIWRDSVTRNPF